MLDQIPQIGFALLLTVGLVVVLGYGAKQLQRRNTIHGQHLKILETMHLSQKEKLALVQLGSRQLLIGVTASQITKLTEFESAPDEDFDVVLRNVEMYGDQN